MGKILFLAAKLTFDIRLNGLFHDLDVCLGYSVLLQRRSRAEDRVEACYRGLFTRPDEKSEGF